MHPVLQDPFVMQDEPTWLLLLPRAIPAMVMIIRIARADLLMFQSSVGDPSVFY